MLRWTTRNTRTLQEISKDSQERIHKDRNHTMWRGLSLY
jgi:hypothetical protein